MTSKLTSAQIKAAALKIEELYNQSEQLQAEMRKLSDQFGVPFTVPHNQYHPKGYKALKSEFDSLEPEDQEAWIEEHGFDPEDYYSEYGYDGWQQSYC